ncbi:MAG TPA: YceI family protein [Streptosporangiaceae bacterium]|jgi:polyisoprenoid-binding protein YceI|nr:YceI family protein [Streptosporangiaceae bacterium]
MASSEQGAAPGQGAAPTPGELLRGGQFAGAWTLDPSRSQIRLRSKSMWGLAPVRGVFSRVSGAGTVSPAGEVSGTITVAADSVDTKNKKRDEHLRSADFFDAENHPSITFAVDGIEPSAGGARVTGSLTVRGRTRPLSFDARVSAVGSTEVSLDAEVKVNRADFGLTWNQMGMASMDNTITVHAVFTRG